MLGAPESRAFTDMVKARFHTDRVSRLTLPPDPGNSSTYFRASSMGGVCLREEALKITLGARSVQSVDPKLGFIFAKGTAYHTMHQDVILPALFGDALKGSWRAGDKVCSGQEPSGRPVLYSRSQAAEILDVPAEDLSYVEVEAANHEDWFWATGHPDGIVDWSETGFVHLDLPVDDPREVIELKTREGKSWAWDKVDPYQGGKPLDKHVLQTKLYLMLTGIPNGRIIYIRKSEDTTNKALEADYAEWRIVLEPGDEKRIRNYLRKVWEGVIRAWSEDVLPERTMCPTMTTTRAQRCGLRHLCFEKTPRKTFQGLDYLDEGKHHALKEIALERISRLPMCA